MFCHVLPICANLGVCSALLLVPCGGRPVSARQRCFRPPHCWKGQLDNLLKWFEVRGTNATHPVSTVIGVLSGLCGLGAFSSSKCRWMCWVWVLGSLKPYPFRFPKGFGHFWSPKGIPRGFQEHRNSELHQAPDGPRTIAERSPNAMGQERSRPSNETRIVAQSVAQARDDDDMLVAQRNIEKPASRSFMIFQWRFELFQFVLCHAHFLDLSCSRWMPCHSPEEATTRKFEGLAIKSAVTES